MLNCVAESGVSLLVPALSQVNYKGLLYQRREQALIYLPVLQSASHQTTNLYSSVLYFFFLKPQLSVKLKYLIKKLIQQNTLHIL